MDKRFRNRLFFLGFKQLFGMTLFGLYAVIALETISSATNPVVTKRNLHHINATQKLETVSSPTKSMTMLKDWRFSPDASQLEITLSAASRPRYFYLARPPRIVVDLPNTKLGYVPTNQNYSGAIQRIRVSRLKTGVTRIVMDLAPGTFVDPKHVQLQPVSSRNPTRWVLRPFIAGERRSLPLGNLPPRPSYLSPTTIAPQPPSNQPLSTGTYNSPQPPSNQPLSTGTYNSPQPLSNQPLSTGYNSLKPLSNQPLSTGTYNSPQPPSNQPLSTGTYNSPQPPSNQPSGTYNPPQLPNFSVPPPLTTLPPTNSNNQQLPLVSVPPLSPNNPSQLPSSPLPPANFPNQPVNPNSVPSLSMPNFPVPTVPNDPPSSPNSNVINFGQPFPNSTR